MVKPLFFTQVNGLSQELCWYWLDPVIFSDGKPVGPFHTRADAETDWAAAHMIEGCRQDLHALNLAVEMPILQLDQADIDLMRDIRETSRAVEDYAA